MNATANLSSSFVPHDVIAGRAREIWLARGCPEGQDVEIWLLAEQELTRPAPALTETPFAKPPRKTVPSVKKNSAATEIDEGQLEERLSRFGDPGQRSPTSLDLS